ncbi:MAG: superoxide dismutase [Caulobacterales bacterium]|nr:superoxide dismutase [Caulobacterales bacterium]
MFILPDLPYRPDALSPVISAETLRFHHGKHHRTYVETVNTLLDDAGESPTALEDVVRAAAGDANRTMLFNNAAQAWNHGFFWEAMSPGDGQPGGDLGRAIDADFGDLAALRTNFVETGAKHFGSGWVWLAAEGDRLKILATHDAGDPLTMVGLVPLTVCDLWEHAYYLDHQNDRKGFLEGWFDGLLNWDLAASQFAAAQGRGLEWTYPEPVMKAGTARLAKR